MYICIVSKRCIQRWSIVVDDEYASRLPNESETHRQRGTSAISFLREHGHPPRIQRAIHFRPFNHLIKLASRKFVLGIALHAMQAHHDLARFFNAAFHEQGARGLGHEKGDKNHHGGPEECDTQGPAPFCGGGGGEVEGHAHVAGNGVADGNVHAVHADEEAAEAGGCEFGGVCWCCIMRQHSNI
jgi:hypothetical protein